MSDFEPGVAQPQNQEHLSMLAASWDRRAARLRERISERFGPTWQSNELLRRAEEVELCAKEIRAAINAVAEEPTYQWQVFDTKRSRIVMEVPAEDVDEIKGQMKQLTSPVHWVLRRRVVGPWEEVQ
jgi:hypothetical protein